jgi:hypothetical protein
MPKARLAPVALAAMSALCWARSARAIDLTDLDNHPIKLDVTETTIVAQHFAARGSTSAQTEYSEAYYYGYFDWLNRLNLQLSWWRFTVGLRLDSAVYANRPADQAACGSSSASILPCLAPQNATASGKLALETQGLTQFQNSIYPAKLWVSYNAPGLEVTVGDAYVQFGRGLILAMRKIDELGLDTTVRGGKIAWQSDPFSATFVAGFANPSRVDEATGRTLFVSAPPVVPMGETAPKVAPGTTLGQPMYGSDRLIGAELQAGRGLPITLATHAVRFTRCSPVHYDTGMGFTPSVTDSTADTLFGSCDPADTRSWLSTLQSDGVGGPMLDASEVEMFGQSLEIPSLWGHGKLYVEAALQNRYHDPYLANPGMLNLPPLDAPKNADGNAIYASLAVDAGPVTNTLEIKSFRAFYPMVGAVNVAQAPEFGNVAYSIPPTTEAITQDSELGFFGVCVNGGRLRSNVRLAKDLLVYGAAAYYHSQSETNLGTCDSAGTTVPFEGNTVSESITNVWDGLLGLEWFFDDHLSHLFASAGGREDTTPQIPSTSPGGGCSSGECAYYHELHAEYAMTKHLKGPFSLELTGHHRRRFEFGQNAGSTGISVPWYEGDNYLALKVSPKYVFSQGFEYTSFTGLPPVYFNGSARWNFRSDSSVVLFVGEQRGGLRCISGVCRVFPAFEGMRAELTVRF